MNAFFGWVRTTFLVVIDRVGDATIRFFRWFTPIALEWIGDITVRLTRWSAKTLWRMVKKLCFSTWKRAAITFLIAMLLLSCYVPSSGQTTSQLMALVLMGWGIWLMFSWMRGSKPKKKKPAT